MSALNLDTDAVTLAKRLGDPNTLLVACLCAEWCGTCREYRASFNALADAHSQICFAWIDIETHADLLDQVGDFDVENFPTILIEDAESTRFLGAVTPQPRVVEHMLAQVSALPAVHGAAMRHALALS